MKTTINWLNEFHSSTVIKHSDLPHVLEFTLLWSVFEGQIKKVRGKNERDGINLSDIKELTNQIVNLDPRPINNGFRFFKKNFMKDLHEDVFITDKDGNPRSMKFCLRDSAEDLNRVQNGLLNRNIDGKEKLFILLSLSWRIRNNLFHGNKDFPELVKQKSIFRNLFSCLRYSCNLCKEILISR